jgi:predicted enzyme related to lactoylglutathione lyase
MKIGLVSVFVRDVTAAHAFYTAILGFETKLRMPEHDLAIVVSAEAPDGTAILLEPNGSPIAQQYQSALRAAKLPCIVFAVDDLRAEHARLTAAGVQFLQEPTTTPYGIQAVLDDTCGNYVQLHQAP